MNLKQKSLNSILAVILGTALTMNILPAQAIASELPVSEIEEQSYESESESERILEVNPIYADEYHVADVEAELVAIEASTAQEQEEGLYEASPLTEAEAIAALRQGMVQRQSSITVTVAGNPDNELVRRIFYAALDHTGNPVEGDYLKFGYKAWSAYRTQYADRALLRFSVIWYSGAAQEQEATVLFNQVYQSLDLTEKSEYDTFRTLYDYVTHHVQYDYAHLHDDNYTWKYTAYGALKTGTAVCQGYAMLLYRLCLQAGLECRVISGTAGGQAHAWVIVRIGPWYYNADPTWDSSTASHISWFLRGSNTFTNHEREADAYRGYNYVGAFETTHPMSDTDFVPGVSLSQRFADVENPSAYYYVPVYWAVQNGITAGLNPDVFGIENPCTRAQAVTFLYKCDGAPETDISDEFRDVSQTAFYAKPVAWARQHGITSGTATGWFGSADPCTRAQIVTFLHVYSGKPQAPAGNPFVDVPEGSFYRNPVLWAYDKGITGGTTAVTFSPKDTCTRAQIVTFLYKMALNAG